MNRFALSEDPLLNHRESAHLDLAPERLPDRPAMVRRYVASDRAAVRALCCDTGFLGKPIEPLFRDRELFADLFTRPYLEYEPEWAWIAEANGRVAGYLLGSVRADADRLLMRCGFQTAFRMVWRLFTGRYARHPPSRRFIRWLMTAAIFEQPKHPPDAAHLHLNLARHQRGRGIGRHLWEAFEERLLEVGAKRCYGTFFSRASRQPELAYVRYGFRDFARCRTTLFRREIAEPVEVVCVCKQL
ncbi:MAG: GNAT family N-acetyltransferase [Verrucomicrobiota bacterium]